jgi:tetratricopeptide (TPR) repeat protein
MKHFLYTLLLLLTLSSCNDWLEVRPRTEVTTDELFADEAGFKDALTSCYLKLSSTPLYGENLIVSIIEYMAQHWTESSITTYKNFQYDAAGVPEVFTSIYGAQYNVIMQANSVLENLASRGEVIEKEALRGIIEAEALAIRGFCHFEILRLFGQVPNNARNLVSLPYAETVGLDPIPYYAYDDFLARVLRDWNAAEELLEKYDPVLAYSYEQLNTFTESSSVVTLEDDFLGYRRFRFNYHAVRALKARLYLYTGQREKAYALAKELIDARDPAGNKVLSLAGANDLNKQCYALPSECFLALHNLQLTTLAEMFLNLTTSMFNDLFAGQSTSVNNRATVIWDATHTLGGTIRPVLRKYNQPGVADAVTGITLATQRQVVPLIRLSEIYLIAMETSPDLAEVNALHEEYMQARNVMAPTLTGAEVAGEILNEYRREFFGEGQMFYTYKRLGATRMLWKTDRDVTEVDYVVPLPTSEYDETSNANIQ